MKDRPFADLNIWITLLGLAMLLASAWWNPATAGSDTGSDRNSQGPVMLNESVSIDGSIILLGDLFGGLGDKARIAVAYAPKPGKRAFFDVNWLYRVAQRYQIAWKPLSLNQRVVVKRSSITIGADEIKDYILAALIEKGASGDIRVELNNRNLRLYVPGDSLATMAVEDISFNPASRRFTAFLIAPVDGPAPTRTRVTGKIFRMLELPVLSHRLAKGEIIRKRDIKWVEIRARRIGRYAITDEADLIGKAAKRGLRMDTPIQLSEVGEPVLVTKGSLVLMTLNTPLMRLTSQGKAQQSGVDGETIRVLNTQSNKIIQAIVTGAGQVRVIPISTLALN